MFIERGKNLLFFDKNGDELNLTRIANCWYGFSYLKKTSVNIYETQHIYILEECLNTTKNQIDYTYPRTQNDEKLYLEWILDNDKIVGFDLVYDNELKEFNVVEYDTAEYNLDNGSTDELDGVVYVDGEPTSIDENATLKVKLTNSQINKKALKLNFYLYSEEEGEIFRNLSLYYKKDNIKYKIAEIVFMGEAEAQDERYSNVLNIFNRDIVEESYNAFKDSDITNLDKDAIFINQKRKELLVTGNDIFPYIGSYRAFINAFKFFGYSDFRLKELFENVTLNNEKVNKYLAVDVPMDLDNMKNYRFPNPKKFKKTAKFSIVFDLLKDTGEVDSDGVPIYEEYISDIEELFLKLYFLRKYLKKYFMPLHSRIVDITAEGIIYSVIDHVNFMSGNIHYDIRHNADVDFDVSPVVSYIDYIEKEFTTSLTFSDNDTLLDYLKYSVKDLEKVKLKDLYPNANFDFDYRNKKFDINNFGAKVTLKTFQFDITWDELDITLDDIAYKNWEDMRYKDIFEIEWLVQKNDNDTGRYYEKRYYGTVQDMKELTIILPYSGMYDVTLTYISGNNIRYSKTKFSAFEVKMKNANIVSFYNISNRFEDIDLYDEIDKIDEFDGFSYSKKLPISGNNYSALNPDDLSMLSYSLKTNFFDEVEETSIHHIDYTNKIIYLYGNYVIEDIDAKPIIKKNTYTYFRPLSQQKVATVESLDDFMVINGIHDDIVDKNINIYKEKTYTVLYDVLPSNDINAISTYRIYVDGNITKNIVVGSTIDFKINGEDDFHSYVISSCYYVQSDDNTLIEVKSLNSLLYSVAANSGGTIKVKVFYKNGVQKTTFNGNKTYISLYDEFALQSLKEAKDDEPFFISYNNSYGDISLYVYKTEFDGEYSLLYIKDDKNLLYYLDTSYAIKWTEYDYDYAYNCAGLIKPFEMLNNKEITGNDLEYRGFSTFDYHPDRLCSFIVTQVTAGGMLQLDDSDYFQFPIKSNLTLSDAVSSLNNSTIFEFGMFEYFIMKKVPDYPYTATEPIPYEYNTETEQVDSIDVNDLNLVYNEELPKKYKLETVDIESCGNNSVDVMQTDGYVIVAIAKNHGIDGLYSVKSLYGVYLDSPDGNYSETPTLPLFSIEKIKNNKKSKVGFSVYDDAVLSTYFLNNKKYLNYDKIKYNYLINPYQQAKLEYKDVITNTFRLDNTIICEQSTYAPIYSTIFFILSNPKVPGIETVIYRLYDAESNTLLIKTRNPYLIWTFDRMGQYTVEVELIDIFGNSKKIKKEYGINILNVTQYKKWLDKEYEKFRE